LIVPRYDAFISYNHAADGDLAPAVERGLQRLAKPWYRLRALSIFRDLSDTGLNPSLWGTVQRQLDDSEWLILLACPESAASRWVQEELAHWFEFKSADRVLVVLTGGELEWDRAAGSFAATSTALSPAAAANFASQPLWLDLRWAKSLDSPPTLRDPKFRSEMARLASPIRDLPPDEIESEDLRLHRTARRLARGAIAALATLAIIATVAAVIAVRNAQEAERRAKEALSRQLGLQALDMPASELDEALLVSIAAAQLDPGDSPERFRASRTLLGRHARLVSMLQTPDELGGTSVRGVSIAPDGGHVAATVWPETGDPVVVDWDGSRVPTVGPLPSGGAPAIELRDDGATIAGVAVGAPGVLAVDEWAQRALVTDGGHVRLIDPADRSVIAEWPIDEPGDEPGEGSGGPPVAAIAGERAVVANGLDVMLVAATDGTVVARGMAGAPLSAVGVRDDSVVTADQAGEVSWWAVEGDVLAAAGPSVIVEGIGSPSRLAVGPGARRVLVVGDLGVGLVDGVTASVVETDVVTGGLAVDPSGRFAAVGGTQLTVWQLATGRRAVAVQEEVNAMAWSGCDGASPCRLVTAGEAIDVWEPAVGRRIRLADQTNAQAVDITADGGTVVSAGWGSTVAVWTLGLPIDDADRQELTPSGELTSHDATTATTARVATPDAVEIEGPAGSMRISTGPVTELRLLDGATRILVERDDVLGLFDTATGSEIRLAAPCQGDLWAVSPLGRRLATHRMSDGRTVVCSTIDGTLVVGAEVNGVTSPVDAIAVDEDGGVVIGGAGHVDYLAVDDDSFRPTGAVEARFPGERIKIGPIAISGGRVAVAVRPTSSPESFARVLVWDAATRGTPVQFETDHRDLTAVALLGEDAALVAAAGLSALDGDVVVHVWESSSRRRLGRGLGGLVGDVVALAGDSEQVVGTDITGRTYRWRLDLDPRREICEIVGRDLTVAEWQTVADGALKRYDFRSACPA
jgi:hypothetical protein